MKKSYLLTIFFLVAVFATINVNTIKSKPQSAPADSSGAPVSNATCAKSGCHGGPVQTNTASTLTILDIGTGNPTTPLNSSFAYTPGTLYNIAFGLTSSTGRYGFQIVPLTSANAMAGSFTVTSASTTQINTLSGRQYMGHKSANTTKNWAFKWTAPAAGAGAVTFYYSYNTADNDGEVTNDVIYQGSVTISELSTGIADINDKVSSLNIFPNPISNEFGVSFNLNEANMVSSQLYSLDGKLSRVLINEKMGAGDFNQQFDAGDLAAGIYLIKLNVGDASITKKIIKQ